MDRKHFTSEAISKWYIERSNNMHTHKKTFRIGASKWQGWQDTKGIIRSCKLKKDRKYNDQQNTTYKTIDGATRTPLKTGVNTDAPERISSSCCTCSSGPVGFYASCKMIHIVRSLLTMFVYTKHLVKEGKVLKLVCYLHDQFIMMTISSWYHWTCKLCDRCKHMLIKVW